MMVLSPLNAGMGLSMLLTDGDAVATTDALPNCLELMLMAFLNISIPAADTTCVSGNRLTIAVRPRLSDLFRFYIGKVDI